MKPFYATFWLVLILSISVFAQSEIQPLASFDRIVASPFVNIVLEKGEQESIRLEYAGIDPQDVNVKVKRRKLHVYLDDARFVEKKEKYYYGGNKVRHSRYGNSSVTAYITYSELRGVEIRGEKGLVCNGPLKAEKFKLKVYGANEVTLTSLETDKFKASIFGSNDIAIKSGMAGHQVYRLFGENRIDTQKLESNTTTSRIYGEGRLTVSAHDELKITAFGEPEIRLAGDAAIHKRIVFGATNIRVKRN